MDAAAPAASPWAAKLFPSSSDGAAALAGSPQPGGGPPPLSSSSSQSLFTRASPERFGSTSSLPDAAGGGGGAGGGGAAQLHHDLQRLYGSLGQLHGGSRSSLPDILEEAPAAAALAAAQRQQQQQQQEQQPAPAPASRTPPRAASEDDLFRLDGAAGALAAAAAGAGAPADPSRAGQLPEPPAGGAGHSRALLVRGVDPAAPDAELRELFECFGEVAGLATGAKARGLAAVWYHDVRAAALAAHTLGGQEVRGRRLDVGFCAPPGGGAAGDEGALAAVALGTASPGRAELLFLFSAYGEVRELAPDAAGRPGVWRVEYYDARHAAAAAAGLAARPELAGALLVVEASRAGALLPPPGGGAGSAPGARGGGAGPGLRPSGSSPAMLQLGLAPAAAQYGGADGGGGGLLGADFLSGMSRSLSEMSLDGGAAAGRFMPASMSAGDLLGAGAGGLRGAASAGSLWPRGAAAGASPLGSTGSFHALAGAGSGDGGVLSGLQAALLQQQQQQQQQAALLQAAAAQSLGSQQGLVQAALQQQQAALQQALLQQQAAALLGGGYAGVAGVPGLGGYGAPGLGAARRGGSEPSLGGRLARRPLAPGAEAERRQQQDRLYSLDVPRILSGEDRRTTLMVKNIPNKYTQRMLLALVEERFRGTFDFFYLPIDFKNRCNVGYAFINMTAPAHIPPLVDALHGRRWPKFNSEKVCAIAYGRIQGKAALVAHFQNSSLLHEDKRCRPVLFVTRGDRAGEPEEFPSAPARAPGAGVMAAGGGAAAGGGGGTPPMGVGMGALA